MEIATVEIVVQQLYDPLLKSKCIELYVLREDLIHSLTGGNKWRKLKYNLQRAKEKNYKTLLTFGGAYSNHLVATAVAGKQNGFKTIGVVRGEEKLPLNRSLQIAVENKMQLHYVSREQCRIYRDPLSHHQLQEQFGDCYILPEGGSNILAVKGCCEIMRDINVNADIICVAVGTGATLTGIIAGLKPSQSALGFCVLKNTEQINAAIKNWLEELNVKNDNWGLSKDYHFGGYAKSKDKLLTFTEQFSSRHDIPIEPIYTGKLFYGIFDLIRKDFFAKGMRILAVHTGGLQYLQ